MLGSYCFSELVKSKAKKSRSTAEAWTNRLQPSIQKQKQEQPKGPSRARFPMFYNVSNGCGKALPGKAFVQFLARASRIQNSWQFFLGLGVPFHKLKQKQQQICTSICGHGVSTVWTSDSNMLHWDGVDQGELPKCQAKAPWPCFIRHPFSWPIKCTEAIRQLELPAIWSTKIIIACSRVALMVIFILRWSFVFMDPNPYHIIWLLVPRFGLGTHHSSAIPDPNSGGYSTAVAVAFGLKLMTCSFCLDLGRS